jgi:ubiquinone biosynthesis protein
MLREAASASQLKRNFEDISLLYVPEVHWPLTKPKLLVQERIYGVPISDIETLLQQNVNLERLAEIGVEIFFTQVFKHSFFSRRHAPRQYFGRYIRSGTATIYSHRLWHHGHTRA